MKRDYISIMPKPDGLTAAKNLAEAFEHYNEWHPHSALGYRSPREQFADPVDRPVSYDAKHMAKVAFWIHAVQFARPDQTVQQRSPALHHGQSRITGSFYDPG